MDKTARFMMQLSYLLYLATTATACAGGSYIHMGATYGSISLKKRADEAYVGCVTPEPVTCETIGTCAYANNSIGPWTAEANIRQMQLADDAYNSLDLSRFNHRDDTIVYMPGDREFNMAQHIQDVMNLYSTYPDNHVSNHPYKLSIGEGNWTFALSDISGTNKGPIQSPTGWRGPTGRRVNYEFMTAAYWEDGRIVKEYIWMDIITLQRQLGFLPSQVSVDGTQSLSLSPFTLPLAVNPGEDVSEDNKRFHRQLETAFNNGELSAKSLRFSPNVTIFTSRDDTPDGLSSEKFLALITRLKRSFSNLRLAPDTIIGSGDWTASIARLSGKHTGALSVLEYISPVPIAATNNTVDVFFYTIARWQNGLITHLKLMVDDLAVLGQLE
ncbi:hypothetical protein FOQG_13632 [Fusarium oxysporum f. sp. raphani 54005]|uniref:SnoaL-like domain-containing protein n=2 Tax=Fusarium oxysporum f. sp. raphani TaxID=96318 RepID=X0BII5_FUSOX|nr:hypothetical protein FOQG_13632 [Fusarium oxysporum f. sp. raphani 54005]KAG7426631.1 hypothetical protein Forpi1262_v012833 [Fusarium oxysporum f. sp. raphani]